MADRRTGGKVSSNTLRRLNRRLRWKKGSYTLNLVSPSGTPSVRRTTVRHLLRTRQWRLALTVAVMPTGFFLAKESYYRAEVRPRDAATRR